MASMCQPCTYAEFGSSTCQASWIKPTSEVQRSRVACASSVLRCSSGSASRRAPSSRICSSVGNGSEDGFKAGEIGIGQLRHVVCSKGSQVLVLGSRLFPARTGFQPEDLRRHIAVFGGAEQETRDLRVCLRLTKVKLLAIMLA